MSQNDDVNLRFSMPQSEEILSAFKKAGLEEYIDDFFELSLCDKEGLQTKIEDVLKKNPAKLGELQQILILKPDEVEKLKNIKEGIEQTQYNDAVQTLKSHLAGSTDTRSYLDNSKFKIKELMKFFGAENIDCLKPIEFKKAYEGTVSVATPNTINSFLKKPAKDMLLYNRWFKRVGISLAALCGITAVSIACIGRTNNFNKDIYTPKAGA